MRVYCRTRCRDQRLSAEVRLTWLHNSAKRALDVWKPQCDEEREAYEELRTALFMPRL